MLKIPGFKDSNEVLAIKQYKEILDVMTPEELDDHDVIKGANRARIARASGKPEDEVAKCLFFFKNTLVVQKWLQVRKENNEKMPASEGELASMQEEDPRVQQIAKAVMYPEGKRKQGRGRGVRL
jgi:signal recognition particle GTPase